MKKHKQIIIDPEVFKKIKGKAAENGLTLGEFIEVLFNSWSDKAIVREVINAKRLDKVTS